MIILDCLQQFAQKYKGQSKYMYENTTKGVDESSQTNYQSQA